MEKFYVGTVVKAQGIKGEVKVKSDGRSLQLVKGLKSLFVASLPAAVVSMRIKDDFAFILFSGVHDRNGAEALIGKEIFAAKSEVALGKDEYFTADIVGSLVRFADGGTLGVIKEVLQNGKSADILVVKGESGKEVLFPFLADLVLAVDDAAKTMTIDPKRFAEVAVYED